VRTGVLVAAALLLGGCSSATKRPDGGRSGAKATEITLFFLTELRGTLEPCGCNSDPLGDIARTAAVIASARQERPVALFDGGSTLYLDDPIPETKRAQAELTADAVARMYSKLEVAASGLGPYDLAAGADKVRFARQAANVTAGAPTTPPRIVQLGGMNIGVFGVVDPRVVAAHGVTAGDPATAAREAIAKLRGGGAELVVGLAHMTRAEARKLAREAPGADFLLAGREAPDEGVLAPEAVGATFIVVPGNRGQVLTRLDIDLSRGGSPLTDAVGKERAALEIERLDEKIARLEKDLAAWEKDPNAEAAFVARNRDQLAGLKKEREALAAQPLRKPETGGFFVARNLRIVRRLPCDAKLVAEKRGLDEAIGKANLASAEPPVAAAPGQAGLRRRRGVRLLSQGRGRLLAKDPPHRRLGDPGEGGQAVEPRLHRLPRDGLAGAGRRDAGQERRPARRAVRGLPRTGVDPRRPRRQGQATDGAARAGGGSLRLALPHRRALRHLRPRAVPARHRRHGSRREAAPRAGRRSDRPPAAQRGPRQSGT
jgi:hypothetical protein